MAGPDFSNFSDHIHDYTHFEALNELSINHGEFFCTCFQKVSFAGSVLLYGRMALRRDSCDT